MKKILYVLIGCMWKRLAASIGLLIVIVATTNTCWLLLKVAPTSLFTPDDLSIPPFVSLNSTNFSTSPPKSPVDDVAEQTSHPNPYADCDNLIVLNESVLEYRQKVENSTKSFAFISTASCVDWLLEESHVDYSADATEGSSYHFTNLHRMIHEDRWRAGLRRPFRDPKGKHNAAFTKWILDQGPVEYNMSKVLVSKMEALFSRRNDDKLPEPRMGLNLIGWPSGMFGLARVSVYLYLSAKQVGLPVTAIQIPGAEQHKHIDPSTRGVTLSRTMKYDTNVIAVGVDWTPFVKSQIPPENWDTAYNVAYVLWELDVFPVKYLKEMKWLDAIWVSSNFIKKSILASKEYNGVPVTVVPIPLSDTSVKNGSALVRSQDLNYKYGLEDCFVFMIVFDFQSTTARKNPEASIRAFRKAFPDGKEKAPDQCVRLIVKSVGSHLFPRILQKLKKKVAQEDPRIIFITDHLSDEDLDFLKSRAGCYVSLHRSEGYGLNILESMAMGTPVIATNYSAPEDFFSVSQALDPKAHFPIPYSMVEIKRDVAAYKKGNHWAEADQDAVVEAMRAVALDGVSVNESAKIASGIRNYFGREAVGRQMIKLVTANHDVVLRGKKRKFLGNTTTG